jgi:hypothetical protein
MDSFRKKCSEVVWAGGEETAQNKRGSYQNPNGVTCDNPAK